MKEDEDNEALQAEIKELLAVLEAMPKRGPRDPYRPRSSELLVAILRVLTGRSDLAKT